MSLTTEQNIVTAASGTPLAGIPIVVTLMTGTGQHPGLNGTDSVTRYRSTTTDASGAWSVQLIPNSEITQPAGTYYQVSEGGYTSNIVVPVGGGPYNLLTLQTGTPPTPAAQYVLAPISQYNLLRARGAWAPSTVYAANDLFTYAGATFVVITAFTSGSVFGGLANVTILQQPPGVFNVRWYGAQGDGVTDDTAAFNAAVAAAYAAGVANSTFYGVIEVPSGRYLLSAACTANGTVKGNSQINIPVHPTTSTKFTLVFRGVGDATALPHWQQTSQQRSGSVLISTLTGLTVDATFGPPSVIGGPTAQQGYGGNSALFNNVLTVVDGISIVVPANPTIMGFNFLGLAEANVRNAAVNASTTPGSGLPTLATNTWAVGLYMPQWLNNDKCVIENYSVEGMYIGAILSEHAVVLNMQAIYCAVGIDCLAGGADSIWIGYASVEACVVDLQCEQISGSSTCSIWVGVLDVEDNAGSPFITTATVNDPSNYLLGEINIRRLAGASGADPLVTGATNARVRNLSKRSGNLAAPAVPASGVAAAKVWRDAAVVITGGTVTAIAVDGVNTGTTAGMVLVPAGRTIAVTYSVAPAWTWTLL